MTTTLLSVLLAVAPVAVSATWSEKRGICYVDPDVVTDNDYWTKNATDVSWYYNYEDTPTSYFADSNKTFVPMQWGLPDNYETSTSFYDAVEALQKDGYNITWTLGYNEPDGCDSGGSCISAKEAAIAWVVQFEPMREKLGIKLGGPACTGGSTGWTWLQEFHSECAVQHNNASQGCIMDFLPLHWYGSWDGLASHLGEAEATYPNITEFWLTEFAYSDEPLLATQEFYNESTIDFDNST